MAKSSGSKGQITVDSQEHDLGHYWLGFARGVRECAVPSADDRALDQLLPFRDRVLTLVEDEAFVNALRKAFSGWAPEDDFDSPQLTASAKVALLDELAAFPRMVEVEKASASSNGSAEGWRTRIPSLLSKASTINGSVKDLLGESSHAKRILILFGELIDLFKGGG